MRPYHIVLIADGRSPITHRWIAILNQLNIRITLVSTYPTNTSLPVEAVYTVPVAFSQFLQKKESNTGSNQAAKTNWKTGLIRRFRSLFLAGRYRFGPITLPLSGRKLKKIIREVNPDLVHALRVPFEGMLAQFTPPEYPLVVSIWGNDFTLHAGKTKSMRKNTVNTMNRTNGLMADVQRDINLSRQWGYERQKPSLVVPGAGGIDLSLITNAKQPLPEGYDLPINRPLIINPRGIRAYTQTDIFFQAIPLVLQRIPDAHFICTGMAGEKQALDWVHTLKIEKNITLLPSIPQKDLWSILHHCQISVSLTLHDGTPNTLLEAMACGSYPIAGDIESIREWITPGVNGLLVDPHTPQSLAEAIVSTLNHPERFPAAAAENIRRIRQKGEVSWVLEQLDRFYRQFLPVPNEE